MRYPLMIVALALGGLMTPTAADAYWWHGAGIGIGGLYRSLDFPTERRVPYFAAHPPVYYSHPVPRTYGHSPFAYTPDTRTPDVITASKPVEIINPYVPSSANAETPKASAPKRRKPKASGRTISDSNETEFTGPLMIVNPFVVSDEAKTI